jgi:AraC-like DNA-binding protein
MGGHVFQYCLSGCGYYLHWPEGKKTLERVGPGQAFLASYDRAFEYYCSGSEPWEFVWVIVRGEFADRVCGELREPSPVFRLGAESTPVVLLRNFLERLKGPFTLDPYSVTAVAYDFLVQLLKTKRDGELGAEDRFPRAVRDFILKNLRTVSLDILAQKFGYSPKYFIAYFRDRMRTTPNRYILLQKVKYASLLLVSTKKNINEIASEVGFSEDNYFSKVFKRAMGLAPTEYRERHRDEFSVDDIIVL